ncbi:MAG: pantoate--beta-alanine ligase [Bacteroidota bacterium]
MSPSPISISPLTVICHTVEELRQRLQTYRADKRRIGFVPTMGALHAGHLSLIARALSECDAVVCSIFVNPAQFNDPSDFANYPVMQDQDLHLLQHAGCQLAFVQSVSEIYPDGYTPINLDFGGLGSGMEGASRPGHFQGMATVVKRLFDIVEADVAYFGEKDFQQLAIVRHMVKHLGLSVRIEGCPTLREPDGLAMSSRNLLLSPETRKAAAAIPEALRQAGERIPHLSPAAVRELVIRFIEKDPRLRVQYFSLVDPISLQEVEQWDDRSEVQGCIAVLTDGPRLIDNMHYSVKNTELHH